MGDRKDNDIHFWIIKMIWYIVVEKRSGFYKHKFKISKGYTVDVADFSYNLICGLTYGFFNERYNVMYISNWILYKLLYYLRIFGCGSFHKSWKSWCGRLHSSGSRCVGISIELSISRSDVDFWLHIGCII